MTGPRRWRGHASVALAVGLATVGAPGLSGCSFMFVTSSRAMGAPNPACTRSTVPPIVDVLGVSAAGFAAFSVAVTAEDPYREPLITKNHQLELTFALMALQGASAIYGFASTHECEKLRAGEDEEEAPPARRYPRRVKPAGPAPALTPPPLALPGAAPPGPDAGTPEVAPPAPPSRPAAGQQADDE